MGKIIACVNEKGGVAKTTTIKNVSIGLAGMGKKVLVVDLAPSANLTKILGCMPESGRGAICDVFEKGIEFQPVSPSEVIVSQDEGVDVITSSDKLHAYEMQLISAFQREVILRNFIYPLRESYDYIFLDCPAGLGIFVTNALFCADELIIPLQPHYSAIEAMQNLFMLIANVRKMNGTGKKPEILGVLFSMVRTNTNNDKNLMQELRRNYDGKVRIFNSFVPMASKVPESDLARKSIYSYAPNSSAALIFTDLVNEILQIENE